MPEHQKIKPIEELAQILKSARAEALKIVHCHGVFDLLHIGHIRHFQQAKKLGDRLIVTITPDQHVNKGPHRPVFNQELRAEAVAALDSVDYVAINNWPTAIEAIEWLRPHFYVKGSEHDLDGKSYTNTLSGEEAAIKAVGGQLVFTDDINFSSSNLINRYLPVFPKAVSDYLADFSNRYTTYEVLHYLESAQKLKVLVVGETIVDEYVYCQTIGKSGKEPVLAAQYLDQEKFAGGVLAVANHVVALCPQTGLLTCLGGHDSHEEFICGKLDPRIDNSFLYMDNAPTIVKRRYVESYPFQKLFELYIMDEDANVAQSNDLCAKLEVLLPKYDVVIVTDYGHGMFSPAAIQLLSKQARFLAVNTQVNAGNHGFNTVSKYPRADYICISEKELRLEARSQHADLRDIVLAVADKLSCRNMVITRGSQGCLCFNQAEGFFEVPALSIRVVDRVGAGDTVFAITSMCVAQKAPMEVVGFIGNIVGAQAVAIMANREPIERKTLYGYIESLMK
jgi:rfaE bifunctional protein kinase chain/domain/rfaE bifunctional protein nucleotidyltransferase chain/domain